MERECCGICGESLNGFSGKNQLSDGCICDKCYEKHAGFRLSQSSYHSKEISSYKKLTVEQFSKLDEIKRIQKEQYEAARLKAENMIISTGDIHQEYEIIGPVYFQCNNATGTRLKELISKHSAILNQQIEKGLTSGDKASFAEKFASVANLINIVFEGKTDRDLTDISGVAHELFDIAFYVSCEEIKYQTCLLGGDAIIYMKQDLNLDTNGFQHFYMQMYGTAVKFIK